MAFLFLLASSGFTMIVHICTMEAAECCDTSGASDHHGCPNEPQSEPITGVSFKNLDDCHINAIVGGLAAIQTLLEKNDKTQNVAVLAVLASSFVSPEPVNTTSWFSYSFTESVSPPSVEKYVLNETFLI
ncbi:MAG: hypothetical protein HY961_14595 [Ignavibacteriae bacterium]|nr:hypothetical protein [Ignavibacteriota bacterium]